MVLKKAYSFLMSDDSNTSGFRSASGEVLRYLHSQIGFNLWAIVRLEGQEAIVLVSEDHGYSVNVGDVFQWEDSFCSRMANGSGPRIAPDAAKIPAYASAPVGQQLDIGAYIGVPIYKSDGDLFGSLCAIDPQVRSDTLAEELPHIELMVKMLETILDSELKANKEGRRAERAEAQAMSDSLTGLYNRRGWDMLLAAEEKRCRRYAHPAVVFSLDLDDLKETNDLQGHQSGDLLLQETARILKKNLRKTDIIARVGGDEFVVLAVECCESAVNAVANRLSNALEAEGISASIGIGVRKSTGTLAEACEIADQEMYECKRKRKKSSSLSVVSRIAQHLIN